MTWYRDEDACDYFGPDFSCCLRAIGWLERGRDYPSGSISKTVYDRLAELLSDPFQPVVVMGPHECDLCQFPGQHMGQTNLFIPGDGFIYVCPELILHYVEAHWYIPPEAFCSSVLNCPPTRSLAYKKLLLANGGRALLGQARRAERPQPDPEGSGTSFEKRTSPGGAAESFEARTTRWDLHVCRPAGALG